MAELEDHQEWGSLLVERPSLASASCETMTEGSDQREGDSLSLSEPPSLASTGFETMAEGGQHYHGDTQEDIILRTDDDSISDSSSSSYETASEGEAEGEMGSTGTNSLWLSLESTATGGENEEDNSEEDNLSTSESITSADLTSMMGSWRTAARNIPADLLSMIKCCGCNRAPYDLELDSLHAPVVLPCAHTSCIPCLESRWRLTRNNDQLKCPRCTAAIKIPEGGILGFPVDTFSLVLKRSFLQQHSDAVVMCRPQGIPKCGLHPVEELSQYCTQCGVQLCGLCLQNHATHEMEALRTTADRLDHQLSTVLKPQLDNRVCQISRVIDKLQAEKARMQTDIQQACHTQKQILQKAAAEYHRLQTKLDEITTNFKKAQPTQEKFLQSLENVDGFQETRDLVTRTVDSLNSGQRKLEEDIKSHEKTARKAQENILKLEGQLRDCHTKFGEALHGLETLKHSFLNEQFIAECLQKKGNISDKVSRTPGLRDKIQQNKMFSGKDIKLDTLEWEYDDKAKGNEMKLFSQIMLSEVPVESLGGVGGSLFPGLHYVRTIDVTCESAHDIRSVTLFGQQYIWHCYQEGHNNDKICVHDTTGSVLKRIHVPGMKAFCSPVVVDSDAGQVVVADRIQQMRVESFTLGGIKSKTQVSGALRWFSLSKTFIITDHEVTLMQWAQCGDMNMSPTGLVAVMHRISVNSEPDRLLVYDNNFYRSVLHNIKLPGSIGLPVSAVNSQQDTFVVVDCSYNQVHWVDGGGRVLQQYGRRFGEELRGPRHIIQHSKGPLLIADSGNHRVVLLSNEATLLQHMLSAEVWDPLTLHLDEQAGLLAVTEQDAVVRVFHFWPYPTCTRKLCLQVQV